MTGGKEGDLARAALLYAVECAVAGDSVALEEIGLGDGEVALLRTLTLEELRRAGVLCGRGLEVRLDASVFRVVVEHLQATREAEDVQRELIVSDAPRAMMRALFGMGSREYARLRSRLGVISGVGRPAELDEAAEHRLWHALSGRLRAAAGRPLAPEAYLAVRAETGVPLRAVWTYARRWAGSGVG